MTNGVNGTCYFPGAAGTGKKAWLARSGGPVTVDVLCKSSALESGSRAGFPKGGGGCVHIAREPAGLSLPPATECDMVPGYLFYPGDYIDVNKFPGIRVMAGAEPVRMSRQ